MTELSNRALLVSLRISQWTARKLDRRETAEVAARHGLKGDIARVNKDLLPQSHELDKIHKMTGAIRTDYYRYSLPWGQDGVQIIKSDAYLGFTQMLSTWKSKWYAAVEAFIDVYPELQHEARWKLNGLYRDEDYPDVDRLRGKFSMSVGFTPVPTADDWRVDVGDEGMAYLREQITRDVVESQGAAMKAAWGRIYDVVSRAHERLASPDNVFRDSLIENARELCSILPSLNITDDPALEAMRQEVERTLCSTDAQGFRDDTVLRQQTSDKLAAIMAQMGGLYGAA